jgi:hypothetical protein
MTYKSDSVKKPVPLRMTEDLREEIKRKAVSEGRSLNNMVETAVKFYLRVANKK